MVERDSGVRIERLTDGQLVAVDHSHARRCTSCRRLRHFVQGGLCEDCAGVGVGVDVAGEVPPHTRG